MSQYFQPVSCDEFGNTHYPYILKGTVSEDGYSVRIEEPAEFKEKWPTVATHFVAASDETMPRRLTVEEVKRLTAQNRPSVRQTLRADR